MSEWVALLRGVNVGGISIRSAELREVFESLGLQAVRTVLASGNVTFTSGTAAAELKARIEKALADRFGYQAWIILVPRADLVRAIEGFPFDAADTARQPWVIFCVDGDTRDELMSGAAGLDAGIDPVAAGEGVVYWNPAKGSSTDTPFAKLIAKARFAPRTTNRNLRTLVKIAG